jgi:hemoglobin
MSEPTLYAALGATPGVTALAEAWHQRVLADPIVAHAFSHGFDPHHTERLAAYWAEALGGPPLWTQQVGSDESAVVRMHSGNGDHPEMDAAAIACFDAALADVGLTGRLAAVLHDYFAWTTTTTMTAYPRSPDDVPDGLDLPHWSWDGLVDDEADRVRKNAPREPS